MPLEIERRFLVGGARWRRHVRWHRAFRQGYLAASADGFTVRVRVSGVGAEARSWLTLKASATAITRHEYEYPIPAAHGEELLQLAPWGLRKTRFGLDHPGGRWVVDVFDDENAPLVLAEVELDREDQPLDVPSWCRLEVTGRGELTNAALALRPWSTWIQAERQPLEWALLAPDEEASGLFLF